MVARSVTDAAADFYRHYLGEANRGNLSTRPRSAQVIRWPSRPTSRIDDLDECKSTPRRLSTSAATIRPNHPAAHLRCVECAEPGALTGTIKRFDQSVYTKPNDAGPLSLDQTGFVFVPKDCEQGAACRVHIALHGCKQNAGEIGRRYIDDTGYNAWADSNRLIVLYPQTARRVVRADSIRRRAGTGGATSTTSDNYVTKSGAQIKAIKAMLDALTAGAAPAAAGRRIRGAGRAQGDRHVRYIGGSGVDSASGHLGVSRLSRRRRRSSSRSWPTWLVRALPNSGLTPRTAYRWRVSAIVNGTEGPASNEAPATTRAAPAPCQKPGTCPIGP